MGIPQSNTQFKTGRSRILKWECPFFLPYGAELIENQGNIPATRGCGSVLVFQPSAEAGSGFAYKVQIGVEPDFTGGGPFVGGYGQPNFTNKAYVQIIFGQPSSNESAWNQTTFFSPASSTNGSVSGTILLEMWVDEWITLVSNPIGTGTYQHPGRDYNGENSGAGNFVKMQEFRTDVAGANCARLTVTIGATVYTRTWTVKASDVHIPYPIGHSCRTSLSVGSYGSRLSAGTASPAVGDVPCSAPAWRDFKLNSPLWSGYNSNGQFVQNQPAIQSRHYDFRSGMAATCSYSGSFDNRQYGLMYLEGAPEIPYELTGKLFSMAGDFPSSVTANLKRATVQVGAFALNPSATQTMTVREVLAVVSRLTPRDTLLYQDINPGCVWVQLDSASLSALGEPADDYRMPFQGPSWDALKIKHESALTVDPCSSTTGWSGVTYSSGIVIASGTGTRSWSPAFRSEGYRYLDIELKGTTGASLSVTVTIGTKSWTITSGAINTAVTRRIDLCDPHAETGGLPDALDSRWPENRTTHVPINDSRTGGVDSIASLSIACPSGTIVVTKLEQVRDASAKVDVLPAWMDPVYAYDSGGYRYNWKRLILGQTDGKQSMEGPFHGSRVGPVAQSVPFNVSQAVDELLNFPGYTVTKLADSGYLFRSDFLPAYSLEGAGVRWDDGLNDWVLAQNVDVATEKTFKGVFLFDTFEGYPGMGRPFGAYGSVNKLRFAKVLRGDVHGFTIDGGTHRLAPSTSVSLSPGPGSATSDSGAYFQTVPGAQAGANISVPREHTIGSGIAPVFARKRTRVDSVGESPAPGEVHMFERPGSSAVYAVVSGDSLLLRRFDRDLIEDFTVASQETDCAQGAGYDRGLVLAVVFTGEGTVRLMFSAGEEAAFYRVMDIGSGIKAALAVDRGHTGISCVACLEDLGGGSYRWVLYRSSAADGTYSSVGTIVSSVDNASAGLEFEAGELRRLRFTYLAGGVVRTKVSPNFGDTWI